MNLPCINKVTTTTTTTTNITYFITVGTMPVIVDIVVNYFFFTAV